MVYRRGKRPSLYFEAKTRNGYQQVCTLVSDKKLALRIEHMWAELAGVRAWDLLEPVLADLKKKESERKWPIGRLYDLWEQTRHNVAEMRRLAADVDVEPLVAEWYAVMLSTTGADWAKHALAHVRHFFPEGSPRMVSQVTGDWLTTTLAAYKGKRNTRRKVHSSLSVFLEYCTLQKKLFVVNPMAQVQRPAQERPPIAFYDSVTVMRVVKWQPSAERQAVMALIYGTGADVSPAVTVTREDFNPAAKEVRIAGTKTAYRDRVARINDALWPIIWAHVKTVLSGRVFPATWNRWTVSDWHRQAVGEGVKDTHGNVTQAGLKLSKRLPLRKARHHFAVRLLQSGAQLRVVAQQLGSDERTVLRDYGAWATSPEDRARAEKMANQYETKKRRAR